MLQYSTVEPGTLEILKKLMALPAIDNFYLAGGTALALYYGHRLSVDIDLFSTTDFNTDTILPALENEFPDFTYSKPGPVGLFGFIGDIKTDFVRHNNFSLIGLPVIENGIRLISTDDIIAMKVAAILRRAVKKDFWDIAELLDHYTMDELVNCYNKKYPNHQLLISIPQALTYYVDAEDSEDPISLKGQTWESVKKRINNKVNSYLK